MKFHLRGTALLLAAALATAAASASAAPTNATPAAQWETVAPESAGYDRARLEALRAYLKAGATTAMVVVVHGQVIFEYGDVVRPAKVASIRKSILAMLFGRYVANGKVDLTRTVTDLGLQERTPFLPLEARATLEQLLTARSGIYLDPRTDDLTRRQPVRGTEHPGTTFFYNNWEFDAAGDAFEKLTGVGIYDALAAELAAPLGMQDFRRQLQVKIPSPESVHPEYAMYLSARDLARLGLLMLRSGSWNGRQVVPADWVRYMTAPVTPWDEMNPPMIRQRGAPERWGFGLGWWVWDASPFVGNLSASPFQGAFEARGTGGQYLTVLPAQDMVLVHQVDLARWPDARSAVTQQEWDAITNLVIASRCHETCGAGSVAPTP